MRFVSPLLVPAVALGTLSAAEVPRPAPALVFRMPDGSPLDLAKYRGKVVGLEFLITTCPHCQRCSQILNKMQSEFGSRGFQAAGVATNEMAHMLIPDYIRAFRLSFPVGFASREQAHEFLQHSPMLIMYMPQMVFIDRKGVIRAQYPGGDKFFQDEENNMRKQILELLKEPVPPASKAAAKKAVSRKTGN